MFHTISRKQNQKLKTTCTIGWRVLGFCNKNGFSSELSLHNCKPLRLLICSKKLTKLLCWLNITITIENKNEENKIIFFRCEYFVENQILVSNVFLITMYNSTNTRVESKLHQKNTYLQLNKLSFYYIFSNRNFSYWDDTIATTPRLNFSG